MKKNNLTKRDKYIQLYSDSGKRLLERFYKKLKRGSLVDPLTLPTSDEYYIWVALRERLSPRYITLGEVCKALRMEGYTDNTGRLILEGEEDQPT